MVFMVQERVVKTDIGEVVLGTGSTSPRGSGPNRNAAFYTYYRCPNGEIQYRPSDQAHRAMYREEGCESLTQYGSFEWNWISCKNPFNQLFLQGGAKEFPLFQVVEFGWHKNPPKVYNELGSHVVVLPQLEGQDIPDFSCPYCTHGVYTQEGYNNHLKGAHKDELDNERLAEAISKGLSAQQRPRVGKAVVE